jgi:hypothetical protein
MVLGLTTELYVEIIEQLKPDYFMTPDGETYLGERYLSGYEINRVMKETKSMLTDVHNCAPIGLVKGSNAAQFCNHAKELVSVGVPLNVFHAGDFVNRESKNTIRVAIEIARAIRPLVPRLWIYGVGAERYFRLFQFADGFITQSHYINAFAGKDLGIGESSRLTSPSRELISRNLRIIQERLIRVHEGTKPQV